MAMETVDVAVSIPLGLKGRFIFKLALKLIKFWNKHRDTLLPVCDSRFCDAMTVLADLAVVIAAMVVDGPL